MLCKAEAMDWGLWGPPTPEPLQENVFTQKLEPSPEGAGQAGPWKRPQSGRPWDSRSLEPPSQHPGRWGGGCDPGGQTEVTERRAQEPQKTPRAKGKPGSTGGGVGGKSCTLN